MNNGFEDLAESLSLEVKREIAERYFTHRKVIEEEIEEYQEALKNFEREEEKILRELLRLMVLLKDPDLLERFEEITGLHLKPYYDEYILSSPTIRKRLFRKLRSRGFTSKGKFLRLFEDTYKRLWEKLPLYQRKLSFLEHWARRINEDIEEFHREYDLGSIFAFFSSLEGGTPSEMAVSIEGGSREGLEEQLRFARVPSPQGRFVDLKGLPRWKEVSGKLLALAKEAYRRHSGEAKQLLEILAT
ncbi:hypothetical protein [Thermosulfurimonas sp.]|uniref:hypothetical protein n=1 Tax=Thermosulfurimonas sp. TaxID=2080236 RepID=UPI0025D06FA3|nr:hypothetical protein [Thermosulfurimonas sp.]